MSDDRNFPADWHEIDDEAKCKDCGSTMLFSARMLGDGLCHCCAHKRYAAQLSAGNAMASELERSGYEQPSVAKWREASGEGTQ